MVDRAFSLCLSLLLSTATAPALAEAVETLVLMPAPGAITAADGVDGFVQRLQTLSGIKLTLTGTTRTGALIVSVPAITESSTLIRNLREQRAVLWVDLPTRESVVQKSRAKLSSGRVGQKFMVRLKEGVDADWSVLSARFSELLGVSVAMERRIGNVWVLRLAQAQSEAQLVDLATLLEQDASVQYADAVLRRFTQANPPNDPYFAQQWNLTDSISGINLAAAWTLQSATSPVTVAVVDTGILPHPDLEGKLLPGYDFISDADRARDGDGRDANPRDEGDFLSDGDCGGYRAQKSSWHGTFVAGLIAANSNNGIGIAGIDANARILPVRALGHCGGTDEDVFEAVLWAAGAPVPGVPLNTNPAKVINLSLGGYGACARSIQEAVDDAMAHGAIVVAAAGNESDDVSAFAPANCSGVITVGAHNRVGERATYSNFGRRVDISAPSGDGGTGSDKTVSLSNDGITTAGEPSYKEAIGTSFSAPMVAGTVSMMIARNSTLTAGRIVSILQATSRQFDKTSPCRSGILCGAGMLDAGVAISSTVPGTQAAPSGTVPVVEFYNAALDHYFLSADPAEINALDKSASFARTGYLFYAYADGAAAPGSAKAVCRFYAGPSQLIDSHFFSAEAAECQFVRQNGSAVWSLESAAAFYVEVPDSNGNCRDGTLPVYRFFNGRRDANQRFSIDLSVGRAMINKGWVPDGSGHSGAAFCSAI
ncbi:MAG: S8 family peptidase [Pseudomonadota bacterium]|nr:S8 family peptidase [Pseudomonadota bacterium]